MMIKRISNLKTLCTVVAMCSYLTLTFGQKENDVLFSVAGDDVTVSEFRYIYEKNNRDEADYSKANLNEYLDLYKNFKLKVARAKELGLDKNENYQRELDGYRKKLADSYILDKEVNDRLVEQILERKKKDVRVSHILMPVKRKAPKAVREEAYRRIEEAALALRQGQSFEEVVQQYSMDKNTSSKGGDIGYMTAALPDGYVELENAMYTLPKGGVSEPLQTDLGYHIIKVTDRRPARGKMEAQHILVRKKKFGKVVADAEERASNIYAKLKEHPENYDKMAASLSEDKATKKFNGNLGVFGIGQYEPSFENVAFALANDGDISEPIETSIGWHIIKRVAKKAPDSRERVQTIVKDKMNTGERFLLQKKAVVEEIKKEVGYKAYPAVLASFKDSLDESYLVYNWSVPELKDDVIMKIGRKSYKVSDFIRFNKISAKMRLRDNSGNTGELADKMYDEFVQDKVIEYMEDRLEDRYADFKNLIREYKEGILLFEVSKKEIWDRASKDTAGLLKYFEANRDKYIWQPRAVVSKYALRTSSPQLINEVMRDARQMTPDELMTKYNTDEEVPLVIHEEVIVERSSEMIKDVTFGPKSCSNPKIDHKLRASNFVIIEEMLPAQHKTLKESRGYVISDYQEQLEKNWLSDLKEKYPIKVKSQVLKKLYK